MGDNERFITLWRAGTHDESLLAPDLPYPSQMTTMYSCHDFFQACNVPALGNHLAVGCETVN